MARIAGQLAVLLLAALGFIGIWFLAGPSQDFWVALIIFSVLVAAGYGVYLLLNLQARHPSAMLVLQEFYLFSGIGLYVYFLWSSDHQGLLAFAIAIGSVAGVMRWTSTRKLEQAWYAASLGVMLVAWVGLLYLVGLADDPRLHNWLHRGRFDAFVSLSVPMFFCALWRFSPIHQRRRQILRPGETKAQT